MRHTAPARRLLCLFTAVSISLSNLLVPPAPAAVARPRADKSARRDQKTTAAAGFAATSAAVAFDMPTNGRIAFISQRDGNREVYTMNADGTDVLRLTNTPGYEFNPAFSPDGRKIAFLSGRDGNNELYVMDADGANQTRLTFNGTDDSMPAWSPDGSQI